MNLKFWNKETDFDVIEKDLIKLINATDPKEPEYPELLEDLKRIQEIKSVRKKCDNEETWQERVLKWFIGLGLPLAAYGIWLRAGFQFEIDNTVRSSFFRNFVNSFKPKK